MACAPRSIPSEPLKHKVSAHIERVSPIPANWSSSRFPDGTRVNASSPGVRDRSQSADMRHIAQSPSYTNVAFEVSTSRRLGAEEPGSRCGALPMLRKGQAWREGQRLTHETRTSLRARWIYHLRPKRTTFGLAGTSTAHFNPFNRSRQVANVRDEDPTLAYFLLTVDNHGVSFAHSVPRSTTHQIRTLGNDGRSAHVLCLLVRRARMRAPSTSCAGLASRSWARNIRVVGSNHAI